MLRFRCWFAHYPCSELRKPCITPIKASEQTTDLHRSLGTPRGGPLCNVAGAHRVAAADEEIPMQLLKLCYPNIPPRLILSYLISFDEKKDEKKAKRLLANAPNLADAAALRLGPAEPAAAPAGAAMQRPFVRRRAGGFHAKAPHAVAARQRRDARPLPPRWR